MPVIRRRTVQAGKKMTCIRVRSFVQMARGTDMEWTEVHVRRWRRR